MRTTIALDDDVFLLARQTAQREHMSLGKAVSKLVRQGLQNGHAPSGTPKPRSKYSIYAQRDGALITSDDVYRLMEQEGL